MPTTRLIWTAKEFYDAANRLKLDRSDRVIVLTGAGDKAFSAGGDMALFASDPDAVALFLREMTGFRHGGLSKLASGHAPFLAAVNGIAAGAGLSLVGVYPRVMLNGEMDAGAWSCGMVIGLINDIPSVKDLVN